MRILIDIGHPAHVHFFKNTIQNLEKDGHELMITAMDKEVTINLLEAYDIDHLTFGRKGRTKIDLILQWMKRDYEILRIAKRFDPDILTGISNPSIAHVAWILGKDSIIFDDTEHASFAHSITYPFASKIFTPACFENDIGKKQIRHNSYHEMAYLHPKYFTPSPLILKDIGLEVGEKFTLLRFISWSASHDIGHRGIEDKLQFVEELEKYGKVIITSEGELIPELKKYDIRAPPEKLHDLLNYASLYVGEGATTAVECAILGTPAIYVSSLAGTMGNLNELENKYGLLFNYKEPDKALEKALEILKDTNSDHEWELKRKKLLEDKEDMTKFMTNLIENYPESLKDIGSDKEVHNCVHP